MDGVAGWVNWRAFLAGASPGEGWEIELWSDARYADDITEHLGPYSVLNTVPSPEEQSEFRPGLILRFFDYAPDVGRAALLSLSLGTRVKSGGAVRHFTTETGPHGMPIDWGRRSLQVPQQRSRSIVPSARRWSGAIGMSVRNIKDAIPLVSMYPTLSSGAAITLVRAARQYQEGLWVCEVDPELAWLRFIGALETAASFDPEATTTAVERLEDVAPELVGVLREACPGTLGQVADLLDGKLGATSRFVEFVLAHDPGPPSSRPMKPTRQVNWAQLRQNLSKIYDWRSKALHTGLPLPAPMLAETRTWGLADEPDETVGGLGEGNETAMWTARDIPMRLHVFEHLTRGVLQGWWASLGAA